MRDNQLEIGDVVEVVYKCLSFGRVGQIIRLSPYQVEFFEGGTAPFGMRSSLKYLGPSRTPQEVLGEGYFE